MLFLYELLAIYAFVPLVRVFIRSAEKIDLCYFAGIRSLFGSVLEMIERILGYNLAINLGFLTSYLGFFIIGYLFGNLNFYSKSVVIAGVIYVVAGFYTVYATNTLSAEAGDYVHYYYWYTRINILLMSFSVFILLKKLGETITKKTITIWLRRFAEASFGIYPVHVFVLVNLKRVAISAFSGPAAFTVPLVFMLILLISWGIVAVIRRIPGLREITP
jgi:surface polysaccharide O-acyltransferase-like enzyme